MGLPRVRLTVRRMMIAVALAAMILEGSIVWNRYIYCHDRATMLTMHVKGLRRQVAAASSPKAVIRGLVIEHSPDTPPVQATGETLKAWADYLETLAQKADRESRHPWLPVALDPPEPK